MTLFNMMGLISTIALLAPILTILTLRLAWYKSFPALLGYYVIVFVYNMLTQDFAHPDKTFVYYFGVFNNFLDAPLMLCFMTYFSHTANFRKRMLMVIPPLVIFQITLIALNGFNIESATIAMGPGLFLVIIFATIFFIRNAKLTIVHQKAMGKTCMVAALLFAYGGYAFIYIVYYLMKTPYKIDTYLVYYLITFFSSLMLAAGIYFERRRVNVLEEIKTTREELKVIYGGASEKKAATS